MAAVGQGDRGQGRNGVDQERRGGHEIGAGQDRADHSTRQMLHPHHDLVADDRAEQDHEVEQRDRRTARPTGVGHERHELVEEIGALEEGGEQEQAADHRPPPNHGEPVPKGPPPAGEGETLGVVFDGAGLREDEHGGDRPRMRQHGEPAEYLERHVDGEEARPEQRPRGDARHRRLMDAPHRRLVLIRRADRRELIVDHGFERAAGERRVQRPESGTDEHGREARIDEPQGDPHRSEDERHRQQHPTVDPIGERTARHLEHDPGARPQREDEGDLGRVEAVLGQVDGEDGVERRELVDEPEADQLPAESGRRHGANLAIAPAPTLGFQLAPTPSSRPTVAR